jgi:signal transduction histidine kinase
MTRKLIGTAQDITESKVNEIKLRKAAKEEAERKQIESKLAIMTDFFTNVSHELNTPLGIIISHLDMMRENVQKPEEMQHLISNATINAYRLTRLVSNILDITKIDAGFLKLNLRPADIVSVISRIYDSVLDYAHAKNIVLQMKSNVGTKKMDLDIDKIDRIVLNLLSNAMKHTPEEGRILIELKCRKDAVTISVKDNGEGIPKDRLDTIFDRFVQVEDRRKRNSEGSGIGLALVKSMTELHKGRVWVESEFGKGSTFFVEIPVTHSKLNETIVRNGFDIGKKTVMEFSDQYIKVN